MKKIPNKYIFFFVLILIIVGIYFFSKKEKSFDYITTSKKYEIDESYLQKPKNGKENVIHDLQKLDSVILNKSLSILSQVKVFDYKRYAYEAFINDYEMAHIYADSAISVISGKDPVTYKDEYAIAYLCKGDVFYSQEQFNEAFAYYYKAKKLGLGYFDSCLNSEYSYRIAMIYYKQESYEDAKDNFINAFNDSESCPDIMDNYHRRQQILSNIGLSFYQLKDYDKAEHYYLLALKFITENSKKFPSEPRKHNEALGVVYGNLGNVYLQKKEYSKSKSMLKKDIEINLSRGNDIRHAQSSYLGLTEVFLEENKLDSAYLSLKRLKTTLDSISTKKHLAEWNKLMHAYYEKKENIPEAYYYLKQYQIKKDDWLTYKTNTTTADLKKQYDLFEHQHNLEILQTENNLKKIYLFITIFIAILVVLLLIIIWLSWKKSKNNFNELSKLNITILSQNMELEDAFNVITESNKEKEKLLNLVAHDLRTPIASLSLMVELIMDEKEEKERNELIGLMKIACGNALNLISETLESNKNIINKIPKNTVIINDFLVECTALLKILADEKQIFIDLDLPKEKIIGNINLEKFKRVINNLVINAIKFSAKETTIKISAFVKNDRLLLSVKDQGIGIEENIIDRIFELESFEYKRSGTDGEQSFGLGLPFCKQIVEEHNGVIRVESVVGKGSTFLIEIPLK
ncbi:tetratricopeptide repeat-containing sensor histidine kinase [uncultured Flavobacterium sp.]|uniref:tetratricopeptide repeat-containing sensor histidine kinase n=1 Tax=uncultured Flavobacterium sp. TaxID=165435 RepID=UPI0030EEB0AA|tara:strand:+ start:136150 stop:138216 length:2067 start_codon:yes stop_codon:yes gene_type:complete